MVRQMVRGKGNLLGDVGCGIDNGLIPDPHMTGRNPTTSPLILINLIRTPHIRRNVSDRRLLSIADEMIGCDIEVLVKDALPGVLVTPPLKVVMFRLASIAANVETSVVAEFNFDGVGGHKTGSRWWRVVAGPGV